MSESMSDQKLTKRGKPPALTLQSDTEESMNKPSTERKIIERPARRSPGLYASVLLTRKIILNIRYVGRQIKSNLEERIRSDLEGKCVVEGFVKPGSTKLVTYSSGLLKGSDVQFVVVVECLVCNPVEGMLVGCIAKNITKAGIRAEIDIDPSPVVIFVARDHSHMDPQFNSVSEGDSIRVRVIGQRFELNDTFISVIGEIVQEKQKPRSSRPKLVIA